MRFQKADALIHLTLRMSASASGLTIDEIAGEFGISRRTAERMRDAVERLFPHLEQSNPGEIPKRWRLPSTDLGRLFGIGAPEIAALAFAVGAARKAGAADHAEILAKLAQVLQANGSRASRFKAETDIELLLEAEGMALRAGPKINIDPSVLRTLRESMLASRKVRLHYRARETGKLSRSVVSPYGLLYGNRPYLVAYSPYARDYRLFSVPNIERIDTTQWSFVRRDFSLREYAARSFGVFQSEPQDVVLRFSPEVAADAAAYDFHPTQSMEPQEDGSLLVRFCAGGELELSWHLFTWGTKVTVIEPLDLKHKMEAIERALREVESHSRGADA